MEPLSQRCHRRLTGCGLLPAKMNMKGLSENPASGGASKPAQISPSPEFRRKRSIPSLWSKTAEETGWLFFFFSFLCTESDRKRRGSWKGGTEQEGKFLFVEVRVSVWLKDGRLGSFNMVSYSGSQNLHAVNKNGLSHSSLLPTRLKQQWTNHQVS